MNNSANDDRPILAALRELQVGDTCTYPAERASYLKSACTSFGFQWGKKFKTRTNRKERTVTAIRVE